MYIGMLSEETQIIILTLLSDNTLQIPKCLPVCYKPGPQLWVKRIQETWGAAIFITIELEKANSTARTIIHYLTLK